MVRQRHSVERALAALKPMQLDWVFHIDDDELIYVHSGQPLPSIVASFPSWVEEVRVKNLEAIFESSSDSDCFRQTRYANLNPGKFCAYANGKSLVKLSVGRVSTDGPHIWKSL